MALFMLFIIFIWLAIFVLALALPIGCLINVASKPKDAGWKVVWALIILVFPIIGSVIYLMVGKET